VSVVDETEIKDAFGRVIARTGTFSIDIPLEALGQDGELTLPDGTIVRITTEGESPS
jgi:hypothetical protein